MGEVIWPRRCLLCGDRDLVEEPHGPGVDACGLHLISGAGFGTSARCPRCMGELPPGVFETVVCMDCRRRPPAFAATLAPFDYGNSGIGEWILRFKHGGRRDLAPPLARLIMHSLRERSAAEPSRAASWSGGLLPGAGDIFVPVPLHPVRLAERGYDQAALLADEVASLCGGQALPLLRRKRATHAQGDIAAPPRRLNVQGAFAARCQLPEALPGKGRGRLWLVDDVMTSGATASACAAALRSAGAAEVRVLAIARA